MRTAALMHFVRSATIKTRISAFSDYMHYNDRDLDTITTVTTAAIAIAAIAACNHCNYRRAESMRYNNGGGSGKFIRCKIAKMRFDGCTNSAPYSEQERLAGRSTIVPAAGAFREEVRGKVGQVFDAVLSTTNSSRR